MCGCGDCESPEPWCKSGCCVDRHPYGVTVKAALTVNCRVNVTAAFSLTLHVRVSVAFKTAAVILNQRIKNYLRNSIIQLSIRNFRFMFRNGRVVVTIFYEFLDIRKNVLN